MSVCSPKALERVEVDYWYQYNYCSASPWEGFRQIKKLKIEKKKYITKIGIMVTETDSDQTWWGHASGNGEMHRLYCARSARA